MFWRRRQQPTSDEPAAEQPADPALPPAPVPTPETLVPAATVARPSREASGMGLRARPSGFGARLRSILGVGVPASEATWDEVEEALIAADVGATTTMELVDAARERLRRRGGQATGEDVRGALANEVRERLERVGSGRFELGPAPSVILFVGVNGSGKTTSIAKLAARLKGQGHSVLLAAGDTFRAAAIEQLRIWGEQIGAPVVAQRAGADPGAVAFDAMTAAQSRGTEAVLVDTAGRLQNKTQLMAELAKMRKVIARQVDGQPRHVFLVLDATTGQNGLSQAEGFSAQAGVTGIVLTKLDGSAKGGVAVAVADRLGVPIVFAGVGEELDGLAPFDAAAYVDWLFAA
ncbi:MAG TPA: signal recognition particle-docking protein FtsY [Candidatus Limnocylindria bacterium]|nr:signal recognition particle-docking protein FtsY [Candidatus Limnocylindria bacterium]